jgi:hypothetical protein
MESSTTSRGQLELEAKTLSVQARRKRAERAQREALHKKAELDERIRRERYQKSLLEREAAMNQDAVLKRDTAMAMISSVLTPTVMALPAAEGSLRRFSNVSAASNVAHLKPLEVVDVEVVVEKTAGGASAVGSENELPESQVSQRSAQGTAIVAKKRSVFAQIQMEWSQSLEQAASAVKAAAQNLGSVHEKWMEIGRQRQEAEYNAQQLKKIAKEEEAQKQARQVWLQVEKDTSRKKAESRMAENAEAVRLREQTVELLRHEAELREAEELEITAERARRLNYARRYQEKKKKERDERERALREERLAIEALRAQERAESIAVEQEKERRAKEAREEALSKKREEYERKRLQQKAERERREQEMKEQHARMKVEARVKEEVRKDMERKAAEAAAEAKAKAAEGEKLLEEQAAAARNEAAKRSKIRMEADKRDAEKMFVHVERSEKLVKKCLKETRQLAAKFEQEARNREEEATARYDAEMRVKREIEFRRREEEHQRDLEATKRHKTWQAAEVREKLRREAAEAAMKKSLAEEERQRIEETNQRERARYEKEWRDHLRYKARRYDEDLVRRQKKAEDDRKARLEAFKETVRQLHESNDEIQRQSKAEKRQLQATRTAFRDHVLSLSEQRELALRQLKLDAEEFAAEQAIKEAERAEAMLKATMSKYGAHKQELQLSTMSNDRFGESRTPQQQRERALIEVSLQQQEKQQQEQQQQQQQQQQQHHHHNNNIAQTQVDAPAGCEARVIGGPPHSGPSCASQGEEVARSEEEVASPGQFES